MVVVPVLPDVTETVPVATGNAGVQVTVNGKSPVAETVDGAIIFVTVNVPAFAVLVNVQVMSSPAASVTGRVTAIAVRALTQAVLVSVQPDGTVSLMLTVPPMLKLTCPPPPYQ